MTAMNPFRLQYFFDPLCGWCYASAPALAGSTPRIRACSS